MKKRILSVLVMSALALSLTACGESEKSADSSAVTITTIAKEDDVSEATTTTSAVTEDDSENETTTSTEEETKPDEEEIGLPDGPVNPTYRTEYSVPYSDYQDYLEGLCTLEELCAISDSYSATSNQTIEHTDEGYVVTARYDIPANGTSMDFVMTFNNRGELIHKTETTYNSQNPDGVVTFDGDFVQQHFKEGYAPNYYYSGDNGYYSGEMEVSADGKTMTVNLTQGNLAVNHECIVAEGYAVVHEDDCTIFYWPSTCEVFNAETRENSTVIERGVFEAILYNEDGKIESIYCYNNTWDDGIAPDGKTYATIQEYLDADINNKWGRYTAEWTYDSNGNVLTLTDYDTFTFYLYE